MTIHYGYDDDQRPGQDKCPHASTNGVKAQFHNVVPNLGESQGSKGTNTQSTVVA